MRTNDMGSNSKGSVCLGILRSNRQKGLAARPSATMRLLCRVPIFVLFPLLLSATEITISSPVAGVAYTSPVHFVASASTSCTAGMNRILLFTAPAQLASVAMGAQLDASLALPAGSYPAYL